MGSYARKLRKPPNLTYVTTRKRNEIVENHKIFLNGFLKVNFKQKLRITEVFMHSHVKTKHMTLSKLQSNP